MAAANSDKFRKAQGNFSTTLASDISDSATTIALSSTSGLPTDTAITLMIDRVDASGDDQASSEWELVTGVVSGNNLTVCLRGEGDTTGQSHDAGAVVECIVDEETWNDMIAGLLVEHNQDGTHKNTLVAMLAGAQAFAGVKTFTATPLTNAIAERSAGVGVTVDGLLIKDGTVLSDGWTPTNETWTYASASTITVPSGAASKYQKGDRIKWTQTTVKYGVIVSVANTVLTIAVNTDYVVTNAAISANYYSHALNPQGYPGWFNWTPTFVGFSDTPTLSIAKFAVNGKVVKFNLRTSAGTSNTAGFTFTLPIKTATHADAYWGGVPWKLTNNNTDLTVAGRWYVGSNTSAVILNTNMSTGVWTSSGVKKVSVTGFYEI